LKGKIVQETVFTSLMDKANRVGHVVTRIVIAEAGNIAITPYKGQIYVFTGFVFTSASKVIGEVDVPDDLVNRARAFIHAKEEFNELREKFEVLLK
jgi:hypothetical protein